MASIRWWNLFDLLHNITGVFRFSKRGSLLVSVMTSAQNWAKRATLLVLDFAILARLNLAGFYFRDFTRQSLWKKALDFAIKAFSNWFYFSNVWTFQNIEVKWNKKNAYLRYFTTEDTVKEWNWAVNQLIICRYYLSLIHIWRCRRAI